MAAKAMLSERLLLLLEREIDDFERLADLARATAMRGADRRNEGSAAPDGEAVAFDGDDLRPDAARVDDNADAEGRAAGGADAARGDTGRRGAGRARTAGRRTKAAAVVRGAATMPLASTKERIDALGQLTRTLEKLLDLKRLEKLASEGGQADEAETRRLRAELLSRLKSLDMRRREGATLFVGVDADAVFGGDG